jgi:hypothetical protein
MGRHGVRDPPRSAGIIRLLLRGRREHLARGPRQTAAPRPAPSDFRPFSPGVQVRVLLLPARSVRDVSGPLVRCAERIHLCAASACPRHVADGPGNEETCEDGKGGRKNHAAWWKMRVASHWRVSCRSVRKEQREEFGQSPDRREAGFCLLVHLAPGSWVEYSHAVPRSATSGAEQRPAAGPAAGMVLFAGCPRLQSRPGELPSLSLHQQSANSGPAACGSLSASCRLREGELLPA